METMEQLISREKEQLAAKKARREALKDALTDLGRMSKTDAFDRALKVRTDLNLIDADITKSEARLGLLKREQALDERVEALAEQTIIMPSPDSPEYQAYRQRLAEADTRREAIDAEYEDIGLIAFEGVIAV
ncbi:hypothetical protein ACSVHC_18100 [Arthrobacter sp. KNU-44]|uniref:hypothetical protein n=1 Tax=Arthrobacter sp. KNU-44 TaxID=3450744 RepID=UPI003F42C620